MWGVEEGRLGSLEDRQGDNLERSSVTEGNSNENKGAQQGWFWSPYFITYSCHKVRVSVWGGKGDYFPSHRSPGF